MLKEGTLAPDFTAKNANGETVRLKDLRGQKVVLYFYPKDDTPGCTKEACSFRDAFSDFKKRGIEVLGVSPGSVRLLTRSLPPNTNFLSHSWPTRIIQSQTLTEFMARRSLWAAPTWASSG